MSQDAQASTEYAELPCEAIVFRALIYKNWVDPDTKRVMPAAFFRRDHEDGLSVGVNTTVDDYLKGRFKKPTYGVGTLHVGRVRDIELDIIQDGPDHGSLIGVPLKSDDRTLAERRASLLARMARWKPQSSTVADEQE